MNKRHKKLITNYLCSDNEYVFVDSFGMMSDAYEEAWNYQRKGYHIKVERIKEIGEWGLYVKKCMEKK